MQDRTILTEDHGEFKISTPQDMLNSPCSTEAFTWTNPMEY